MHNLFLNGAFFSTRKAYVVMILLIILASTLLIWPLYSLGANALYLTYYLALFGNCMLIFGLAEGFRRAAVRAKNAREQLEFALDAAQQGYWNLNLKTQVAERSLLHDQIFGYGSLLPKWTYEMFLSHVYPDDRRFVDEAVKAALLNNSSLELQCRIYRANDKGLRWIRVVGKISGEDKNAHMLGLVQDITEQKKIEDTQAMLSSLVEFSDEAIVGKNLRGAVFSWNKAAENLYGYTEAEMIGSSIRVLFPKDRQDEFEDIMSKVAQGEHMVHLETLRTHKDGHIIPVSITISPIKNTRGEIIGASTTARDITQQKLIEEKLRHLAEHDALTGLINRPLFEDRLVQAIALAKRHKEGLAVLFIDLDDFKQINDTYGHFSGDVLLCAAAMCMKKCMRGSDTVARFGGDEFAVLLTEIKDEHHAVKIAKKIIQCLSEGCSVEDKKLTVTLSIGISFYPNDGDTFLIEKADAAMYYVKKHDKNNFKIFDSSLQLDRRTTSQQLV